jgi:hypothetical protein
LSHDSYATGGDFDALIARRNVKRAGAPLRLRFASSHPALVGHETSHQGDDGRVRWSSAVTTAMSLTPPALLSNGHRSHDNSGPSRSERNSPYACGPFEAFATPVRS